MARGKSIPFLTPQELAETYWGWVNSSPNVEDRVPSEKMGRQFLLLADHLLQHHNFRNYPLHLKEEMKSEGVVKCLKNLKNIKPEYVGRGGSLFAYLTQTCYCAFVTVLKEHYKDINNRRKLMLKELEAMQTVNPNGVHDEDIKELKKMISIFDSPTTHYPLPTRGEN